MARGGTRIPAAIECAFTVRQQPGTLRIVTFLSDGYIGNEARVLNLISRNIGKARIYAFGVGTSVMGFFFARKPSRSIALFGLVAAFGAELGRFDLTSLAGTMSDMPIFLAVIMFVSLISYSLGIGAGWLVESLLKGLWRLMKPEPAMT